jgi:hypothetical protein
MNFPSTYLHHKDLKVSWTYAWGKVLNKNDKEAFFHCAHFDELRNGQSVSATHISIHDPDPHYFEVLNGGFGMLLNAMAYDANAVRVYIKDKGKYIKQRGHCRKHRYSTSCYATVCTDNDIYRGIGWCGSETSNKDWADIIYKDHGKPIVDNWEWLGIKLDDGRDIMVYNTKRKQYCCLVESGKAKRSKNFFYQANYLELPEWDLKITIVPTASKKIFSPQVGMEYSAEPFRVLSNKSYGHGIREITYGGEEIDKDYLYTGG